MAWLLHNRQFAREAFLIVTPGNSLITVVIIVKRRAVVTQSLQQVVSRGVPTLAGAYSLLKLLTGLAVAALIAWKLTVSKAITNAPVAGRANIHHAIVVR